MIQPVDRSEIPDQRSGVEPREIPIYGNDRSEILSIGSANVQIRKSATPRSLRSGRVLQIGPASSPRNLNPISPLSDPDSVEVGGIGTNLRRFSEELKDFMDARGSKTRETEGKEKTKSPDARDFASISFLGNTPQETLFYPRWTGAESTFLDFPPPSGEMKGIALGPSVDGTEEEKGIEKGYEVQFRMSPESAKEPIHEAIPNPPPPDFQGGEGEISESHPTNPSQPSPVQRETGKKPAMEAEPAVKTEGINQSPKVRMEKLASYEKGNTNTETIKPGEQTMSDVWNLRVPAAPERSRRAQPSVVSRPLEVTSRTPSNDEGVLEVNAVIEGKYPANRISDDLKSPPPPFEKGGRGDLREGPELQPGGHWGREIPDHSILPSGARVLLHPPLTPLHGGEGVGENGKRPVRTPESSGAHFDMGKRETQVEDSRNGGDSERGWDASGKGGENIPIAERGFQPSLVLPEVVPSIPADHPVRAELVQRLAAEIRLNLYPGNNELEIKLQPEHLGKLKIKILEKENVFTIEIKTAHSDVKGILEQGLSALKQNLEGAGVAVGSFNVLLENGSGGAPDNPLWRETRGRGDAGTRGRGGEGARGRGSPVRRAITGEGIVNILV